MHELPITQSILDLVVDHARRAGATRVTDVHLVIGELSRVVDDSVQFYWDILTEGTMAAAATLHFRRVPFQLECQDCAIVFEPNDSSFQCAGCGGGRVRVVGGDDLRVDAIDVETADEVSERAKEHQE